MWLVRTKDVKISRTGLSENDFGTFYVKLAKEKYHPKLESVLCCVNKSGQLLCSTNDCCYVVRWYGRGNGYSHLKSNDEKLRK